MPIIWIDNDDQNIARIRTKMSDDFTGQNNANLPLNSIEAAVDYFSNTVNLEVKDESTLPYDHMYASNTENGEVDVTGDDSCQQSAGSEVKFWKEWLILHLDLIQQQSDEILNKERTILYLQQENEMLKERISCMERGAPFQPDKFFNTTLCEEFPASGDMTQDSGPLDEDNKNCIELLALNCENGTALTLVDLPAAESPSSEAQTPNNNSQVNYIDTSSASLSKTEVSSAPQPVDLNNTGTGFDFAISSTSDIDPMKNLRMSIRRKRLSNSSGVSNNNDFHALEDHKRHFRRYRKKRKRALKDTEILTTTDQYVTQLGDNLHLGISNVNDTPMDVSNETNLEVPRWRVKVYASCYSMEGTENLDDEVYNKRHLRLENDERRRKRWDFQRIREQRVVEKLKQRQDRVGSNGTRTDQDDVSQSLWPKLEDINCLEITEDLPVTAFGCLVPKIAPREFSLPWLNNPSAAVLPKKAPTRKSIGKRRNPRR